MAFYKPMLCKDLHPSKLADFVANNDGWICQDKIDGCRAIVTITDGVVAIQGRKNPSILHRYPEFNGIAKSGSNMVIDAEICTGDGIFNHLQQREQNNNEFKVAILKDRFPCKLFAFDCLEYDGKDLSELPYSVRFSYLLKAYMDCIIAKDLMVVLPIYHDMIARFEWAKSNKKEGIILKRLASTYKYGKRSPDSIKVKHWKEANITFTKYDVNSAGITVENANGTRCLVAGRASQVVKDLIDANGSVELEIQYLEVTKNGAYRMPTYKRVAEK